MQQQVTVGGTISATGPRAVIAAVIGNGLEWYNFMLYGVFASIIAKLYFATANALTSLLLSLGTFSVGFFMRPLGAAVLGAYSDKNGRKAARIVKKHGVRLVPKLYEHLNPMPYDKAQQMEAALGDSLRKRGYLVFGGH